MVKAPQSRPVTMLHWGVKQSFRTYVEATGGVIEVGGGAERAADGGFIFAASQDSDLRLGADGKLEGLGRFRGEVRFSAHGGMLSVGLADPGLEIGASGAALTVGDGVEHTRRLPIARLDLAAMTFADSGEAVIPTALTMDGSQLLGDHYPPTTALDPLRLVLAGR